MKSSLALVFSIFSYHLALSTSIAAAATGDLRNVTLIACEIDDLREQRLQDATELFIFHCNIPILPNAIFLRHSKLESLQISESKIWKLEDFSLNGLHALKSLDLARNNISHVKSWSDEDLLNITALDLRRNSIRGLAPDSFRRFPNLQKLNLAVNLIEAIPEGVLRSMPALKYINIGKNQLKQIDMHTFRSLHKLSHLALHYNHIVEVNPRAFDTNNHLRSLRLEANSIVDLKFMAQMNLARLVHLNLSCNAIDSLKRMAFTKDTELKSLDVSYNLIEEIYTDTLSGLESLEMFNASHNHIHTIAAKSFLELTSLTHLDISANNLTHLPLDIFNTTRHLNYINLSNNALEHLESNHFHAMSLQLRQLDLSINNLHRDNFIEGLLAHRRQQRKSHHLPAALELLDLSYNAYSVLNLSGLYEFERVDLSGNLWDCKWLIREMIHGPAGIRFGKNYTMRANDDDDGVGGGGGTVYGGDVVTVPGADCYDETNKRSIILIDGWNAMGSGDGNTISSLAFWSNIGSNHHHRRLDNKDIIIAILLLVILGFIGVQTIRMLVIRWSTSCNAKRKLKQSNKASEMEKIEMMSCSGCDETLSAVESNIDEKN